MKVSIITVCKNSAAFIEAAIESVVAQTYGEIEYIIVDGNSTDGTREICDRYAEHITHFVSEEKSGIYQAMNQGIAIATGEILYFLNSDDYLYDATVISDVMQFMTENPHYDFVYGNHEARYESGKSSIHQPTPPAAALEEFVSLGKCFIQPESFFKAHLFEKLGRFNERYRIAADYEWFVRLLSDDALQLAHYPRVIVSYAHGGASSQIRSLFEEVFAIQNQIPLYQEPDWVKRRMEKLQSAFIDKYDRLEKTHKLSQKREQRIIYLEAQEDALQAQVGVLREELEALKHQKFGLLRWVWRRVKRS